MNVNELAKLLKIEYLNIGENKNVKCLNGLSNHTELL